MNNKHLAALALAITGTLAAGAAHAGGRPEVHWSVTVGSPHIGVTVGAPIYAPFYAPAYAPAYAPVYAPIYPPVYRPTYSPRYAPQVYAEPVYERHVHAPRYFPQPVVVVPQRGVYRAGWRHDYKDSDQDGIPNRYDRHYNPRWDRDADGVPNRYDRYDRYERNPNRR